MGHVGSLGSGRMLMGDAKTHSFLFRINFSRHLEVSVSL